MPFRENPFESTGATPPAMVSTDPRYLFARPSARVALIDLETGEIVEAQYNPTELTEAFEPRWNAVDLPGMSYQPLQYANTSNMVYEFDLYFNAYASPADLNRLEDARKLLQAWCLPKGGAETIPENAPPRLLFVWPGTVSMVCVLRGVNVKHSRFNRDMQTVQFVAAIRLEEYRTRRLTQEDVKGMGTFRGSVEAFSEDEER